MKAIISVLTIFILGIISTPSIADPISLILCESETCAAIAVKTTVCGTEWTAYPTTLIHVDKNTRSCSGIVMVAIDQRTQKNVLVCVNVKDFAINALCGETVQPGNQKHAPSVIWDWLTPHFKDRVQYICRQKKDPIQVKNAVQKGCNK